MTILHVPVTASNQAEWTRRAAYAINQLIVTFGDEQVTSLAALDYAGNAGKFIRVNATEDGFEFAAGGGGTTTNALTMNNGGAGAASGTTFDGSVARTISYNTVGAAASGHNHAGVYEPADATLTALAAFNTNGVICQTAADTFAGRTLTAPAAGLTITNPAGIAGNPTFALADDLSALEALSGTNTIYYRSAASTWTAVAIHNDLLFSGGTLGLNRGTSFPGSPSSGDRFLRTDRNIRYFYDGTRWLSEELHHINITISDSVMPTTATTGYKHRVGNPFSGDHQLYIEKVKTHAFQTLATTASNYFSIAVILARTTADGGDTTLATHSTQSLAQNDWINQSTNINATAVLNAAGFALSLTETGAQSIFVNAEVSFRLVG